MECSKQKKLMHKFWYKVKQIESELDARKQDFKAFWRTNKMPQNASIVPKEVSKLYTIKELKGVAKMRSKVCSQRLQNNTKTSSPMITAVGKCIIPRTNEALVAFLYDQIQARKCVKVSFAALHYQNTQKEQQNLQKSERKKTNQIMASKLVSTHSLK